MISFHDDYHIIILYKRILSKLESLIADKGKYIEEYKRCKKISECSHNPDDRQTAHTKYTRMSRIIPSIEDGTLVDNFNNRALPIIQEYMNNQGNGYVFGMNNKVNVPKRVSIITRFMHMVNDFVRVEWTCTFNMEDVCPRCFTYTEKRSNVMVCKSCNTVYAVDPTKPKSSDPDDTNKESTYKSSKNYKKEYLHLCGLQNSCEADEIDNIRSYIYRSNIKNPTRIDIRTCAIPRCGYKNYNDTNYIYSEITGEPLPPIAEYLSVCTDRFEKYYTEFINNHTEGNITNLHFLTKLFLFQEGVPTQDDWFRKLSDKTEKGHRTNAIRILSILKDKYPDGNWVYPPSWDT